MLWFIQDRLVVVVPLDEPAGRRASEVDVEVTVDLRLPYMQIAPMTYVTNHATNRRSLVAHGERPMTTTAPARVAEPAVPGSDIKLGLTLYSLTSEWAAGRTTWPACSTSSTPRASAPASRSSPRRRSAPTPRSPTSSSASGATRSTGTASCRARSAATSTWAAVATAT